MRTARATLAGLVLAAACGRSQAPTPAHTRGADSLVLERSPCFGFCPAYRLRIRADGAVSFTSHDPRDTTRVAVDSIQPRQVLWLVQAAERSGFFALPPVIAEDHRYCPLRATDHSTATVAIYRADSATTVVDYQGCYAATDLSIVTPVAQLRHFEMQIDSVVQSGRWTRFH